MGERMKAAIHRWQERRRQRRIELQERRNTARTTLRDYKQATGHEGGARIPWLGLCHRAGGTEAALARERSQLADRHGPATSTPPESSAFTRASASAADGVVLLARRGDRMA
jgi:hypothetical protein